MGAWEVPRRLVGLSPSFPSTKCKEAMRVSTPQTVPARVPPSSQVGRGSSHPVVKELFRESTGGKRSRSCVPDPEAGSSDGEEGHPPTAIGRPGPSGAKSRLVQMHLDFGQSLAPTLCPACGLLFDVCDEDQAVHRKVCNAMRSGKKSAAASSPVTSSSARVLVPLQTFLSDLRSARAAGIAANNKSTPASMAAKHTAIGRGKLKGSVGCDAALLSAISTGSSELSDANTSQSIEAASTASFVVGGRVFYAVEIGPLGQWYDHLEMIRPGDPVLAYLRGRWGACPCLLPFRILLLMQVPPSGSTPTPAKKDSKVVAQLEVVGSLCFRSNSTRVHEPSLYTKIGASIRSLQHQFGQPVADCDAHPFTYHPLDADASGLQRPLCWRDEAYVRGRRLHGMSEVIPLAVHTPTTMVDVGGVHLLPAPFAAPKPKRSVLDLFGKTTSPPLAEVHSPDTVTVPLIAAAVDTCVSLCGVAALRTSQVCAFASEWCECTPLSRGDDLGPCALGLWENGPEASKAIVEVRARIEGIATKEGAELSAANLQALIDRHLLEIPTVHRFSLQSECPSFALGND